jgi:hypothetical protein
MALSFRAGAQLSRAANHNSLTRPRITCCGRCLRPARAGPRCCRAVRREWRSALYKHVGAGVAHPDGAVRALPDQHVERQLERDQRGGDHERCARRRATKDQHVRGLHRQANARGRAAVIDVCKHRQRFALEQRLESLQCLLHRVRAHPTHDPLSCRR